MMFRVSAMVAALLLVPVLAQAQLRATAGRSGRSRFRRMARRLFPEASIPRCSAGRPRTTRPSRSCASMTTRSTRLSSSATAASPPAGRTRVSQSGRRASRSRRRCSRGMRLRWSRLRCRLMAARSPRRPERDSEAKAWLTAFEEGLQKLGWVAIFASTIVGPAMTKRACAATPPSWWQRRLYPYRVFTTAGGFMSYGIDLAGTYRRAASYVDLVLEGAKQGRCRWGALSAKFKLVVNLKAARPHHPRTVPPARRQGDRVMGWMAPLRGSQNRFFRHLFCYRRIYCHRRSSSTIRVGPGKAYHFFQDKSSVT